MGEMEVSIARESDDSTLLKVAGRATTFRFIEEEPAPAAAAQPGKPGAKRPGAGAAAAGKGGQG